jgi:hypothetical protein
MKKLKMSKSSIDLYAPSNIIAGIIERRNLDINAYNTRVGESIIFVDENDSKRTVRVKITDIKSEMEDGALVTRIDFDVKRREGF